MPLDDLLSALVNVEYKPRTLQLNFPADLTNSLSVHALGFLGIAFDNHELTILDLASDKWKNDELAIDYFFNCDENVRVEILAFLSLYVHEYTHRVDFLISPVGLQYYAHTLREYWLLQEFFPAMLDEPRMVDHLRFLAGFDENVSEDFAKTGAEEIWGVLQGVIHYFYAWGDVSSINPLGKYVKEGWGVNMKVVDDYFGVGVDMEPITVFGFFHTFRPRGIDKFWYLRPPAIFETKAVVNSLLFILWLLEERGPKECLHYYEKVYLGRKTERLADYFFLLDLGARIYRYDDFHDLLKKGSLEKLRSTLVLLSSICWYALQAPPFWGGEDINVSNPILRFWLAFNFLTSVARGELNIPFNSADEALLLLDNSNYAKALYQMPIENIIPSCQKVIDDLLELNQKRTWHPDVKKHFDHIFTIMRPHFANRDLNYVSHMGMPDHGSPLFGCKTQEDWEIIYDDYQPPDAVKDWFNIRNDLFFTILKPADEIIKRLDEHFLAFLIPYICKCRQGITSKWASRFAHEFNLTCAFCGCTETVKREDTTNLSF